MKIVKLLWIDDMEEWASSAQENLQIISKKHEIDLRVVYAKNGEDFDVEQKSAFFDFDGIIMDYHMTPFNGDKYIRDMRNEEHLENTPIIFYSQDPDTDLGALISDLENITTVFRGNLEDKIIELFFK